MANNEFVDSSENKGIIHNASFVKNVIAVLPDFVTSRFSKLIQAQSNPSHISGQDYFRILKGLIDSIWRELDTSKEIKGIRETFNIPTDGRKKVHTVNVKHKKSRTKVTSANSNEESCLLTRSLSFPCPMHGGTSKSDHDLGYCKMFFEADNSSRFQIVRQHKLCFTCLKQDCLKASTSVCISNVPPGLICSDCGQQSHKRIPNVLICWDSSHKRPSLKNLETDLVTYFKAVNKNLVGRLKAQYLTLYHYFS